MKNDSGLDIQKQRELLYKYYMTHGTPLSEKETESLRPILNTLKNSAERYGEPVLLAEGGEKRVYRIYDKHLNRYVAMAKPPKEATASDQERFLREGQLTANLIHPNIVPIHNTGMDSDGLPFFSMELLEGGSLKDILHKMKKDAGCKSQYSQEALLGIFNKVCDAIAYAHSRGVLHLDLKPDNIRVGLFGEVSVCDWGLARIKGHIGEGELDPGQLDGDILNDVTLSGIMKGTPGFMAPEQIAGEAKTPQTDIYALGAILYMIMTHELPVEGKNTNEVVDNTRTGKVVPPNRRGKVPSGLAAVAMKALATHPRNRYSNVQELQKEINRFLSSYPTKAEHAGILNRMVLLSQRHRKLSLWLIAFLTLLTVVVSINLSSIRREKEIAEENFALYKEEQEVTFLINEKLSSLSFRAKNVPSYIHARHSISVLELLLKKNNIDPETKQLMLKYRASMHFVLQHFNAALHDFEQLTDPALYEQEMQELCHKYATIKPNDLDLLPDTALANLIADMGRSTTLAMFVYYHVGAIGYQELFSDHPEEHVEVVGEILDLLNGVHEKQSFSARLSQHSRGWNLDLSHTPYSAYVLDLPFAFKQNVINPLNLYSLDISHSAISLLRELKGLRVKELRMVGVFLSPESEMATLLYKNEIERVILGKGEYSKNQINQIRKRGVEVIEEDVKRVE